jgi:hypothetical protein
MLRERNDVFFGDGIPFSKDCVNEQGKAIADLLRLLHMQQVPAASIPHEVIVAAERKCVDTLGDGDCAAAVEE